MSNRSQAEAPRTFASWGGFRSDAPPIPVRQPAPTPGVPGIGFEPPGLPPLDPVPFAVFEVQPGAPRPAPPSGPSVEDLLRTPGFPVPGLPALVTDYPDHTVLLAPTADARLRRPLVTDDA